jgi:hypothetical protein
LDLLRGLRDGVVVAQRTLDRQLLTQADLIERES